MVETWTPEFERMWRCRLVEMNNKDQPFREFIQLTAEYEVMDAFRSALNEIDRLRSLLPSTTQHLDQPQRPEKPADDRALCTSVVEINP